MLYTIYLLSAWLHILAAITWVGGMFTLLLVVVPSLRRGDRAQAAAMLRDTGPRLRDIGRICFGLLAITGTFNLWARAVRLSSFGSAAWLASPFGRAVLWKLGVFGVILGVSAAHDFIWVHAPPSQFWPTHSRRKRSECGVGRPTWGD